MLATCRDLRWQKVVIVNISGRSFRRPATVFDDGTVRKMQLLLCWYRYEENSGLHNKCLNSSTVVCIDL